jgi:uncharacterized membrane protein (UPF0127 family)
MHKVKVFINNNPYLLNVADTEDSRMEGLKHIEVLPKNRGMIFVFDEVDSVAMWMQDTVIPLDIIFLNKYGRIISVYEGEPLSLDLLEEEGVKYVIEVNVGSGAIPGTQIDLSDLDELYSEEDDEDYDDEDYESEVDYEDEEEDNLPLLVIDERGKVQMELKGGERIFSRKNTKTMIALAKRAYKSKLESDYKKLGKKVFEYLDIQDGRDPDYVEIKNP